MTINQHKPRLFTPEELALVVKTLRETRKWSQELLSEISGIHVRTIQRIEKGKPSNIDSRRALARAFDIEDIDAFNKPYLIPTDEELKAEKERFDKEHIILQTSILTTGKMLADLLESSVMDIATTAFEVSRETDECFAELIDYYRDYRDIAEMYSEREKLSVHDGLQKYIDALKKLGVSICYATRNLFARRAPHEKTMSIKALYIVGFTLGKEPKEFAAPRKINN